MATTPAQYFNEFKDWDQASGAEVAQRLTNALEKFKRWTPLSQRKYGVARRRLYNHYKSLPYSRLFLPVSQSTFNSNSNLYDLNLNLISTGYTRLVTGDYGSYVEIAPSQIVRSTLHVPQSQQWRVSSHQTCQERHVHNKYLKYLWLESDSGAKFYHQLDTVKYADYKPGYWYVCPSQVQFMPNGDSDSETETECESDMFRKWRDLRSSGKVYRHKITK